MKQKQILIILIVIILAVIACFTTYLIVHSHQESFMALKISNSCSVDVPNTNNTIERLDGGINKYIFPSSELNITHQKSKNNSEIKSINTKENKNSEKIEGDIYRDSSTGTYSTFIENKETGDALLITSGNLDLLKKVSGSVKFKKFSNTNTTNNTTDNTTTDNTGSSVNDTTWQRGTSQQSSNQSGSSQNRNTQPEETPSSEPSSDEEPEYPSFIPWPQ